MVQGVSSKLIRHPQFVLTLVMYKLARKNCPAACLLELLQMLPKFGSDKACLSSVLRVILSFSGRPGLRPLRLKLLYDLWLMEDRIYPHLQKALEEGQEAGNSLEFDIAKARVIRDVCERKPDQRGRDLLLLLDGLVKKSKGDEETAVATLAIEGIVHLSTAGVIDIRYKILSVDCPIRTPVI